MFHPETYINRRLKLKNKFNSGLLVFLGNNESPMNYPDNPYHFHQDSSFLYFWGLDVPGLAAVIDIDEDKEIIFGDDITVNDSIWMGAQPTLAENGQRVGIKETAAATILEKTISEAVQAGRSIHILPQYRFDNIFKIASLLNMPVNNVNDKVSINFIKAIVEQRAVKSDEEVAEIEAALDITYQMHVTAMKKSRPGVYEREVAGMIEGIAYSMDGMPSFPVIFSVHGEILHNHYHGNLMKKGDMVVNDSGAESNLHYAADITRTIPIGGKFSERQKQVYTIVIDALEEAIANSKPGVEFREVHIQACKHLASGLKDLGLMKGDIDEAVDAGAHALFFQCGLGHMLGLDAHDMEGLGEQYVGYTDTIKRNPQFGICSLRMGRALEPGFVMTVEPGLYFIPQLIDTWKADNKLSQFINYDQVEKFKDFGGIRLEDDILITAQGNRLLGKPIPKTIDEVEILASD
jgi:Xaa-Pro aminopeptidase